PSLGALRLPRSHERRAGPARGIHYVCRCVRRLLLFGRGDATATELDDRAPAGLPAAGGSPHAIGGATLGGLADGGGGAAADDRLPHPPGGLPNGGVLPRLLRQPARRAWPAQRERVVIEVSAMRMRLRSLIRRQR